MGCAPCQKKKQAQAQQKPQPIIESNEECPYTEEQLVEWKRLILCAREKNVKEMSITDVEINKALGIVLSALGQRYDYCYFKKQLDNTQLTIIKIVNYNQCQLVS